MKVKDTAPFSEVPTHQPHGTYAAPQRPSESSRDSKRLLETECKERLRRLAGEPILHSGADIAKSPGRHVVSILDRMYILNEPAYRLVVGLYRNETFEALYLELNREHDGFRTRAQLQKALDGLAPSMFVQSTANPANTSLRFFKLFLSARSVRKMASFCEWMLSVPAFLAAVVGSFAILNAFHERVTFNHQEFSLRTLLCATPLLLLGALVHEIGHATAAYRFGARSGGIGFAISSAFLPSFYVDVTPAWTLPRSRRLLVDASGCYFQLLFVLSCVLASNVGSPDSSVLVCTVVLNLSAVILNLLPIFELDGYWMLVDLLNTPRLQEKTLTFWLARFRGSEKTEISSPVILYSAVLCLSFFAGSASLWSMLALLFSRPGNLHYSTFLAIFLVLSSLVSLMRMEKMRRNREERGSYCTKSLSR